MASIAVLPRGVTVDADVATKSVRTIATLQLWDIENDVACRSVRERLTELDLNALVIPAAANSQSMLDSKYEYAHPFLQDDRTPTVPFLMVKKEGKEILVSGKDNILAFLDEVVIERESDDSDTTEQNEVVEALQLAGSYVASWLRFGRGTSVASCASPSNQPKTPPILYSYEGNQFCRLVREVFTELDIVYELRSAGKESPRRVELASITGGSSQCPYLIDGDVKMPESKDIVQHLYQNYARWTPPNELLEWTSNNVMGLAKPLFATLAPLQAGSKSEDDNYAENLKAAIRDIKAETTGDKVVLYTYDLSPFSSETKALLDSLNVAYREISLGKEWIPGLIAPEGSIKRAALLEMTGQSSLPHIFVGGKAIGGLFSGSPGLVPGLESGDLMGLLKDAQRSTTSKTVA